MREQFERYRDLLGIEPGASPEEIRRAYRRAVKTCHPDAAGADNPQAEQAFKQLTQAYRSLLEDAQRREQVLADSQYRGLSPQQLAARGDLDVPDIEAALARRRRRLGVALAAAGVAAAAALAAWATWAAGPAGPDRPAGPVSRTSLTLPGGVSMAFVELPPGQFHTATPRRAGDNEGLRHVAEIPRGFFLSCTEVTQAQWQAVMGSRPWSGRRNARDGADLPATCLSLFDAEKFCAKLSRLAGRTARLPTELEWEYAARAGSAGEFCYGDGNAPLAEYAWYEKNTFLSDRPRLRPVAGRKPNAWGLFDMHGNAAEWCYDQTDRYGPHCIRGGSWQSPARFCRSGFRGSLDPQKTAHDVGFRVLMEK